MARILKKRRNTQFMEEEEHTIHIQIQHSGDAREEKDGTHNGRGGTHNGRGGTHNSCLVLQFPDRRSMDTTTLAFETILQWILQNASPAHLET
jgi:hypothetical protein